MSVLTAEAPPRVAQRYQLDSGLGPLTPAERDVNDFDETRPGPWEWDVKRLAASMEVAARKTTHDHGNAAGWLILALGDVKVSVCGIWCRIPSDPARGSDR